MDLRQEKDDLRNKLKNQKSKTKIYEKKISKHSKEIKNIRHSKLSHPEINITDGKENEQKEEKDFISKITLLKEEKDHYKQLYDELRNRIVNKKKLLLN